MYKPDLDVTIGSLEDWFHQHEFVGYDPFDIKGHPLMIPLQKYSVLRKFTNLLFEMFPRGSRKLMNVKPAINFKGVGLLSQAYLYRFRITSNGKYLNKARRCLNLLERESSKDYMGNGWGYPFDWQSTILIPKDTPSVVVSVTVGDAFLLFREITKEKVYDPILQGISEFLIKSINIRQTNSGLCFSYTPLDSFYVHNANLFAAYYLIKTGTIFDQNEWCKLGMQAVKYTLHDQLSSGGFTYWGSEHQNKFIDNFHTGYVLRMLNRIQEILPSDEIEQAIGTGMKFYLDKLFDSTGFPLHSMSQMFPIEIHTLNETLLVYSELDRYRGDMENILDRTLSYLLEKMQGPPGMFHYKHYSLKKVTMPFYRWNQAWTYMTLAQLQDKGLV